MARHYVKVTKRMVTENIHIPTRNGSLRERKIERAAIPDKGGYTQGDESYALREKSHLERIYYAKLGTTKSHKQNTKRRINKISQPLETLGRRKGQRELNDKRETRY